MTKAEREALLMEKLAEKKAFDDTFRSGSRDGCSAAQGGYSAKYIAGVDEVGRGPLAGPVVAACVVLPEDFDVPGVELAFVDKGLVLHAPRLRPHAMTQADTIYNKE